MFIRPILPPPPICLPQIEPIGTPAVPLDPDEPEPPEVKIDPCEPFLRPQATRDYLTYIAPPTTAKITPLINGRNSNGTNPDIIEKKAFDMMQDAIVQTKKDDEIFLAAWTFKPDLPLTAGPAAGAKTWGELFQAKALQGVDVRILMTEFNPRAPFHKENRGYIAQLDKLIDAMPAALRGHLQYQMSLHPVTELKQPVGSHHQKFLIVRRGAESIAFCGGLDISWLRTPVDWGYDRLVAWHDMHMKIEGLLVRDLTSEFVQRWNREWGNNPGVAPRKDWGGLRPLMRWSCAIAATPDRNVHRVQMQRTVSVNNTALLPPQITKRDDIWQGYLKIVDCVDKFLYMENQYFRETQLADAIVARAARAKDFIVIIIVPAKLDEGSDPITEQGNALQHEFFRRLDNALGTKRLRVYTMEGRFIHSKLIMADDRVMSLGSSNANRRGFRLDTELNVAIADEELVKGYRQRIWEDNLSVPVATIANWKPSDFFTKWDAIANANVKLVVGKSGAALTKGRQDAAGECVIPFDYRTVTGKSSIFIPAELTELDNWSQGTMDELATA